MRNRQYVIHRFSPKLEEATTIIETDIAEPQGNQVLIQNRYVGINAVYDRELYRGAVPYIDVTFPYVFGVEAVGEVIATGTDANQYKVGDPVGTVKVGTAYQEYQLVGEENLIPFPAATPEYLTLSPTGISAYLALMEEAQITTGQTVVISAAAGGLGHIMVQLCKMLGCYVIAICGGKHKKELLMSLGCCDRIIDYKAESVEEILNSEYNGRLDVAIDSVGRGMFDTFLSNLANRGRLIVVGLASELADETFEKIHAPRVYESMYWKGASVRCFMNHLYKEKHNDARAYLFDQYQKGQLEVKIDQTKFEGIESIAAASRYLLDGQSCGKVIAKL